MRYILDESGYIDSVSCTPFNCKDKSCQEYTGTIPSGYDSLQEWAINANIRAYKIVDNNLVYDEAKDAELCEKWANNGAIIFDSGSNDNCSYLKYSNGFLFVSGSADIPTLKGGGANIIIDLPCEFINSDYNVTFGLFEGGDYWSWLTIESQIKETNKITLQVWSNTPNDSGASKVSFMAFGRYK